MILNNNYDIVASSRVSERVLVGFRNM